MMATRSNSVNYTVPGCSMSVYNTYQQSVLGRLLYSIQLSVAPTTVMSV